MNRFDDFWWDYFKKTWNEQKFQKRIFGHISDLIFEVRSHRNQAVVISWNKQGEISDIKPLTTEGPGLSKFTATEKDWSRFMDGEFSATEGALNGDIKFEGNFSLLITIGNEFNHMATIGNFVNTKYKGE